MDADGLDVVGLIAESLGVDRESVSGLTPVKAGMTNRSFRFLYDGEAYIIRVPGEGTDHLIDRTGEAAVCALVRNTGICEDIVFTDPDTGVKITRFIRGARTCDPRNWEEVARCLDKLREFHALALRTDKEFDLFERLEFYESLWGGKPSQYPDYCQTKRDVVNLKRYLDAQNCRRVLAHIDAVPDNFLLFRDAGGREQIRLIDWEYAGMQDPHVDVAMFCIYAMYDRPEVDRAIDLYFQGACPPETRTKIYCYIAVCGLLWSNWCEYKRDLGVEFGEYAARQYGYAKEYSRIVEEELNRRRSRDV